MLTKEQILGAADLQSEDVQIDEWGGSVRVTELSGTARDALQAAITDNKSGFFFEAALAAFTVADESGALLFTSDDIPALQAKSPRAVAKVAEVAIRINGLGEPATDAAVKNSSGDPSADSGSDLASNSGFPSAD